MEYKQAQNNSGFTLTLKLNAFNIASITCQDLSRITYFNYDQKGHNATKLSQAHEGHIRRLVKVLTTSVLVIGAKKSTPE